MKVSTLLPVLPALALAKPYSSSAQYSSSDYKPHSRYSSLECRAVWPSTSATSSTSSSTVPSSTEAPPLSSPAPTTTTTTSTSSVPTLYLAGDSKMAPKGGGNGTEGWGQYLHYSFLPSQIYINNSAIAGRSARSYTREGRFAKIAAALKPGDWVVIEFGTNDGGSPYPAASDNGRADCPGFGNETCPTVYLNATEIVQTYVTYVTNATSLFLSKGAKVIIASPTPNNPWEFGNYSYTPTAYTYGAWLSAAEEGGPTAGVYYVPHSAYAAQAMFNIGIGIDQYFPLDHGHTAPYLAGVMAQAFVLGLKCGGAPLQNLVVNVTSRIEGPLLGTCLSANDTLPI